MPLPWLIGAAVVGIGAAILASDDDSGKKSSHRDDELSRDEFLRQMEKQDIEKQANKHFASKYYGDFISPLENTHIAKAVNLSRFINLFDDFDKHLEPDMNLLPISSEIDYDEIEIIFNDLDDMYGDFSEVTGSILNAHRMLTGEYLSLTKEFDKNLKLAYKINKTRHKIQDVLEDNDE